MKKRPIFFPSLRGNTLLPKQLLINMGIASAEKT
jgi:hypothetical protein